MAVVQNIDELMSVAGQAIDLGELRIGSDLEISQLVGIAMSSAYGAPLEDVGEPVAPYVDGKFWGYDPEKGYWTALKDGDVRGLVYLFDGKTYEDRSGKEPRAIKIRLNHSKMNGIVSELRLMQGGDEDFFLGAPIGLNCQNGFLAISGNGEVEFHPGHEPGQRQRQAIPAVYEPDVELPAFEDTKLGKLVIGCFRDKDEIAEKDRCEVEKADFFQEFAAAVAMGLGPNRGLHEPKILIMEGLAAQNGKSEAIKLLRGLVPQEQTCSLCPTDFEDQARLIQLRGKTFNFDDELPNEPIKARLFKKIAFGNTVTARDLYKSVDNFEPIALNAWASNFPVRFESGVGHAELRRALVLRFENRFEGENAVPDIARRILAEESHILLAWLLEGAKRIAANGAFSHFPKLEAETARWAAEVDLVNEWIARGEKGFDLGPEWMSATDAYQTFSRWAVMAGYESKISNRTFWQRLKASPRVEYHQVAAGSEYRLKAGAVAEAVAD